MNSNLPVDDSAKFTLTYLLEPFTIALSTSENISDIAETLIDCFPPGLAYEPELRLRIKRSITTIIERKELIIKIIKKLLLASICLGLPYIKNNKAKRQFYYMREDIIR